MGSTLKGRLPVPNLNTEKDRWCQLYKVLNEPRPEIIPSPRQAVWKKNKSVLWYYPAKEKKYDIPLFMVYSLLNKPYILDISEQNSVIGNLTKQGYDVYMYDWGSPGLEDKDITLDNYILDYLEMAIRVALRHSKVSEISLVGYCIGGTLSAILASITDLPIKNLVLAAVPIDYSDFILPDQWVNAIQDGTLNLDRMINAYEVIPSEFLYATLLALQGFNIGPNINLITRGHDQAYVDKWRRMDKWLKDPVTFSGAAFKQMLNELYKNNKLVKGELVIGGKRVDLRNIDCNILVITSTNDNLVLESQSLPVMDLVSSEDKTYQLVEAGHVSICLTGKFAFAIDPWLSTRSDLN
ncbi:alpha/beta fold hydrolase [Mesobacillus maritimus]|uniref:alpha/beta fold hydrolase n=1 Tax=Mesobacillus maritimus TaxID=1643336 RepID=UPI00203D6097|nr:alpha/beta fold hydrolase [Mesobacillus maritimus]MCM3584378.1 alpha/beta fold hydrolase [Mesobacillus maritimus]MCM3669205.1 alpha/beta fold hydrolase [Mesobacillus maritimus]